MIVKGTKQLGSFKRGINLYVPRKTQSSGGITTDGLLLYLDANSTVCNDLLSQVLMQGWEIGDRTLSPIGYFPYGKNTYQYGDETVRYETGVWIYENSTLGEIARVYSFADYPWEAPWETPFSATRICIISTWNDLASPSNNVTLVGSPAFTSSTPKHFSFNGSNQYGTSTGETVPSTAYTKCVWFRLNSYATNNLVSSSAGGHFMYFNGSSTLYCGHSDWPDYQAYPSTANFNLNTWYFAVLTFNTTDGMKLYIDGQLDSTYTVNKNAHPGDGSVNIATYDGGNLLNGDISIVMTYNRSITASEALTNYNATKSIFGY